MKTISYILIFSFVFIFYGPTHTEDFAYITNQESHKLDVIDLKKKEKVTEIDLGKKPAAIFIDEASKDIYIANPGSNNVSLVNLSNNLHTLIEVGNSPLGVTVDKVNNYLFVSNWYDIMRMAYKII